MHYLCTAKLSAANDGRNKHNCPLYGGGSGNAHTVTERPSTPKQRAFLLLNFQIMSNKKTTGAFERSEFVVSQQTAKWFRLLQHLNEVWDEANECITQDYGDNIDGNSPTADEVVQCFAELSEGIQKLACLSINDVMGQKNAPRNLL